MADIQKPNDIFVATFNNPNATTYDLLSIDVNPENTSFLSKDEYKNTKFVQDRFKTESGDFDEDAFNDFFTRAAAHYAEMTNEKYLDSLDEIEYSPFDITRPVGAKTFKVNVEYTKDFNPFQNLYSRTGLNSIDQSEFSARELAQQEKIFDPETNTWSEKSANDLGLIQKLFGDTLVYAQYDEDTIGTNPETGKPTQYKKGDWKVNENGNLYLEKLAGREIYGRQVVNPMDLITTDGSIVNKFDFLDSDGREKSVGSTAFKLAVEVAPLLIPGVGQYYGAVKAGIGLASVLPTFYKSFESLLLGDADSPMTRTMTAAEGYMAKFAQTSLSEEGAGKTFGAESMANMVSDIFTQLYEQRAVASLSKIIMRGDKLMEDTTKRLAVKINQELLDSAVKGKIAFEEIPELAKVAMSKIPQLQSVLEKQSKLSKALSLGYMALTSTGDIYGEAINSGYDKRTAGFSALVAAAGQYGIMMNNRMGDWFLDKTTGYNTQTNKALVRKSITPWFKEVQETFKDFPKDPGLAKGKLAILYGKMKNGMNNFFMSPSVVGEAMLKNAFVEGVEEVTEELVLDSTRLMVDTLAYLGLTEKQGSFKTAENFFTGQTFEKYLANFVGGVLGGGLFEFQRSKLEPWLSNRNEKISTPTRQSLYELIAGGQKEEVIKVLQSEAKKLGNNYLSAVKQDGVFLPSNNERMSQADLISSKAIEMVNAIDGIINSHDLAQSDEEIIRKSLRDNILIKTLSKSKPEGKNIGIEGIILQDYKNNMRNIIDTESAIRALEKTEGVDKEGKLADLKERLKFHKGNIEKIMSGEKAQDYFDQISFYVTPLVNEAYLMPDKNTYTRMRYDKEFSSLPASGIGITQESVTKDWEDYLNSTDLIKKLEIATKAYKEIEKAINKPIADYVETGYESTRRDVLNRILDLKNTIRLFNTSGTVEQKEEALKHFIEINDYLDKAGQIKVAPWDVYNTDIYSQLKSLGLIKKLRLVTTAEGLQYQLDVFGPTELNEVVPGTDITKEQQNEKIVQNFFKKFPLNPLNAETIIDTFNESVKKSNNSILEKISVLESKEVKTEEDLAKIAELQNEIIDINISPFEDSAEIMALKLEAQDEWLRYKTDNSISDEDLLTFAIASANPELYNETFQELLINEYNKDTTGEKVSIDSWQSLTKTQLKSLIQKLDDIGIINDVIKDLPGSENARQVIDNAIATLSETTTDEEFNNISDTLDNVLNLSELELNKRNSLKDNEVFKQAVNYSKGLENELKRKSNEIKPNLLKIHNYAFDLLMNQLESGVQDKELFLEAEKMFNGEMESLKGLIFNGLTKLSNEDFLELLNNIENYTSVISGIEQEYLGLEEEATIPIKEILDSGFFDSVPELKRIIESNFDPNTDARLVQNTVISSLDSIDLYKSNIDRVQRFIGLKDGLTLQANPLYDFIRRFSITLDSNPRITDKVLEIIDREEKNLKSSSNVNNFSANNIREQDVNQTINLLKMLKTAIYAMSTTTVSYEDPVGFIAARQNFAKRNKIKDDVINLKTINSDQATLMISDIDRLLNKLTFLKELSLYNSGKMVVEQETIRSSMTDILLETWRETAKKVGLPHLPEEEINKILSSKDSQAKKLQDIEDLVFETNKNNKEEALVSILNKLEGVDSSDFSRITRDVKKSDIKSWDLATYFATVLAMKAKDFNIKSLRTIGGFFQKAPFYTQELAARIARASTVNPTLFAKILEIKKNPLRFNTEFITIITGGAGTGKTSAVFGIDLDNFRQTNETTKLWISAPSEKQVNNLQKNIIDSVSDEKLSITALDKNKLFEVLGIREMVDKIAQEIDDPGNEGNEYIAIIDNKIDFQEGKGWENWLEKVKFENLPNLLLIDEITHYSTAELVILNEISKISYDRNSSNFMKIIGAGDSAQMGYLAKVDGNYYNYNINGINAIYTPRLWATIRATNSSKRDNEDAFMGITDKIITFFENEQKRGVLEKISAEEVEKEATRKSLEFLKSVDSITGLSSYRKGDKLLGDIIIKDFDKSLFAKLKAIATNPNNKKTIGILTDNGSLSPELNAVLTEVGLINLDGTHSLELFTPKNIQGNEVDYFIFDAKHVGEFNRILENIRALRTYLSRSKDGTIVIDTNNILESKFDVKNGPEAKTAMMFEMPTAEVIKRAVEKRTKDLNELLGNDPKESESDNFKWKLGATSEEATKTVVEEEIQSLGDSAIEIRPNPGYIQNGAESNKAKNAEESARRKALEKLDISKGEFKYMLHGFYNNPNAVVTRDKIENHTGLFTDLNLNTTVVGKEEVKKVINDWLALKNFLLHETDLTDGGTFISGKYKNYLKYIFKESSDFKNDQRIQVDLVLTSSTFDSKLNSPYKKHGLIEANLLKENRPFINLSAKLKFGNAVHYVTLATFGTEEKILETIGILPKETDRAMLSARVSRKFEQLIEANKSNKTRMPLELLKINKQNISFLTSTMLWEINDNSGKRLSYPLTSLKENFPGLNVSEIRLFPNDKNMFRNVFNKYTFGEPRSEEDLFGTDGNSGRFKFLRNRPYVVVSFADDINGQAGSTTVKAAIIPVGSYPRSFNKVIEEVNQLRQEVSEDIHKEFEKRLEEGEDVTKVSKTIKPDPKFNAKLETLFNRSQILDVLIQWATTSVDGEKLINYLDKGVNFTAKDEIFNKSSSLLDVLNNFRGQKLSASNFKRVIESVKKITEEVEKDTSIAEENKIKEIKKRVIKDIKVISHWQWNFHNLFAYGAIIDRKEESDFWKNMSGFTVNTDALFNDDGYKLLKEYAKKLLSPLEKKEFFYSVPIEPGTDGYIVNKLSSGLGGNFDTEFFGDKFFINVVPEQSRLLVDLTDFFNADKLVTSLQEEKAPLTREEELNKRLKNLDSLAANLIMKDNILDATESEINNIVSYVEEVDKVIKEFNDIFKDKNLSALSDLNTSRATALEYINKYNQSKITSGPVTTLINDTKFELNGETISPLEELPKLLNLLTDNSGNPIKGSLISKSFIEQKLKDLQTNPNYIELSKGKEVLEAFLGDAVLNTHGEGDILSVTEVFNAILDTKVADAGTKKEVLAFAKKLIEQLKMCK